MHEDPPNSTAHYNTLDTSESKNHGDKKRPGKKQKQKKEEPGVHAVVVAVSSFLVFWAIVLSSTSLRILPTCSWDAGPSPPLSIRLCSLRSHLAALFSSRAASRSSRSITGGRWSIGVPNGATIRSTTWWTVRLLANPDANSMTSPSRRELRGSATRTCVTLG